jgi:hypothetical protein
MRRAREWPCSGPMVKKQQPSSWVKSFANKIKHIEKYFEVNLTNFCFAYLTILGLG